MTESISYRATFRCDTHGLVAEVEVKRAYGYGTPAESWSMVNGTGMWFREIRAFHPAESVPGGCQACRDEATLRARVAEREYWDAFLAPRSESMSGYCDQFGGSDFPEEKP